MHSFKLPTGRTVEKNALFCVAVKARGRWQHKFFKSYKGAQNEYRWLCKSSEDTRAYYDIQEYKIIKAE